MTSKEAYQICLDENKRIKEYETKILQSVDYSYLYALNIIKGRWPEFESIILKQRNGFYACLYACIIMKKRWSEAEPIIQENPTCWNNYWNDYCNHFGIKQNKCNWKLGL